MPRRPTGVCSTPGCPLTPEPGRERCPGHDARYRASVDSSRPSSRERGYDSRWEQTRAAYLEWQPTCERTDCDEPATDVDHIDGLGPLGPRGHDFDNLRALCHPHHSQRTAHDQPGGWAKRRSQA